MALVTIESDESLSKERRVIIVLNEYLDTNRDTYFNVFDCTGLHFIPIAFRWTVLTDECHIRSYRRRLLSVKVNKKQNKLVTLANQNCIFRL